MAATMLFEHICGLLNYFNNLVDHEITQAEWLCITSRHAGNAEV